MMKKTMKKMAALTMAGMMAMSISTGTVSVLAAETDEVEGWEVEELPVPVFLSASMRESWMNMRRRTVMFWMYSL